MSVRATERKTHTQKAQLDGGKLVVVVDILGTGSSVFGEKWHSATWYESYGFANTQSSFSSRVVLLAVSRAWPAFDLDSPRNKETKAQ